MTEDQQPINQTEELIDEFIAECEREAAKLEITVDYYLAEFVKQTQQGNNQLLFLI